MTKHGQKTEDSHESGDDSEPNDNSSHHEEPDEHSGKVEDEGDLTVGEQDDEDEDDDIDEIKRHPSYEQVLLDVNRCAGRLEHIRKCYLHRTDDDDEPPEDLSEELEFQRRSDCCEKERLAGQAELVKGEDQKDQSHNISEEKLARENAKLERITNDLKYQRKLKKKLAKLILRLLIKKPELHYYQGFHDVCLTYMTINGDKDALNKLDTIIDSHFSAFMQPTMIETQEFLALIPIIIGLNDNQVLDFLEQSQVGTIFALSWVITWFSHVIPNERDVEDIYTKLESVDDPHLILYLCAAIVLHKRNQLLELEPEMSTVHKFLSQVPRKEKLPVTDLLEQALAAFERWPPSYVKQLLDKHRRNKLQVHNYSVINSLARRFVPSLIGVAAASNTRTAIIVFVVASALAIQLDRWIR